MISSTPNMNSRTVYLVSADVFEALNQNSRIKKMTTLRSAKSRFKS